MLLKIGSTGPEVAALVADLRQLGFGLPASATYDLVVKKSVEAFQVSHVDASGLPLLVDGKVGMNTRWALDAALGIKPPATVEFGVPPVPAGLGSAAGRAALDVALAERAAGHGEVGGDNLGQYVQRYLDGKAPMGSSWCAGFVSHCFRQALGHDAVFGYIVGAQALHNRMRQLGHAYSASLGNPPLPGDIIVWRRADPSDPESYWKGHVGIVHSFANGMLWTVEGNRGSYPSKVNVFQYSWSSLVTSATNDKFKGLYGLSRHP